MRPCAQTNVMIEKLADLVNADAALVRRGRWFTADVLLEVGDACHHVTIRNGRIDSIEPFGLLAMPYDFAIRASAATWAEFWQPVPKPRHHDIMALIREGKMRVEGDLDRMMANLLTLKLMLEKPRQLGTAS
jgi:hypothetical protein